ncbi:MAG: energy transducer TonB [Acidobacteriota bacterium]
MALSIAVDAGALFPGDRVRAESFERRLESAANRKLGENRIAIDREGRDLRIGILNGSDNEILIALSSRGTEAQDFASFSEKPKSERDVLTKVLPAAVRETPNILLGAVIDLLGQAISANWGGDCNPVRTLSAQNRFAFELPPNHPEARERYLSALAPNGRLEPSDPQPVGSLLALSADGEEERLSSFRLADETLPERFLVTDDGLFVVAFDLRDSTAGGRKGNTLIYRAEGSLVARLTLDDLLTPDDLEALRSSWSVSSCGSVPGRLSAALDDGRDLLILKLNESTIPHEIAIDLKTGTLLTPRRDLLPHMRLTISSGLPTGILGPAWNPPVCVGPSDAIEPELAFSSELVREPPPSFYDHSIERPLPTYTEIAKRARLRGTVEVEVVVSETGSVSCARVTRLSMRLDTSAEAAALRWKFQPFVVDGKPVRTIGRFSFRFGGVKQPGER